MVNLSYNLEMRRWRHRHVTRGGRGDEPLKKIVVSTASGDPEQGKSENLHRKDLKRKGEKVGMERAGPGRDGTGREGGSLGWIGGVS